MTALTNGNYVVDSPAWGSDGTQPDGPGAATWGNGATGISGVISAANSLVGGAMGDVVGWADGRSSTQDGVIALTNGNYVVDSMQLERAEGAATWGNGTTGSHRRRLRRQQSRRQQRGRWWVYGSSGRQRRRRPRQRQLCRGKPDLEHDATTGVEIGAVTWGNGTTGVTGPVSTANSLVGGNREDEVGGGVGVGPSGVAALTNGNYVVDSPEWGVTLSENAGVGAIPLGAVTWENGTKAATGTVSVANSLVGVIQAASGQSSVVGTGGVTALTNGNYVVDSPEWNDTLLPMTDAWAR